MRAKAHASRFRMNILLMQSTPKSIGGLHIRRGMRDLENHQNPHLAGPIRASCANEKASQAQRSLRATLRYGQILVIYHVIFALQFRYVLIEFQALISSGVMADLARLLENLIADRDCFDDVDLMVNFGRIACKRESGVDHWDKSAGKQDMGGKCYAESCDGGEDGPAPTVLRRLVIGVFRWQQRFHNFNSIFEQRHLYHSDFKS